MRYLIGTRGSKLALAQTEFVCRRLAKAYPEDTFEIQVIQTKGDKIKDRPLHEIGDKGLFVKEIEEKLLDGQIHIAVHSMKDMPAVLPPGLILAKAWKREDARDALILRGKKTLDKLPAGAVIGTGSRRREIQLRHIRSDIQVSGIRGNVETRIRKMEEEKLDGVVLAACGLIRLGMQEKITQYLDTDEMIPAPAQGILALEIRENNTELLDMLNALSDEEADFSAKAERGFLEEIGGGCHTPAGAICRKTADGSYMLDVVYASKDGRTARASAKGGDARKLAENAAASVRRQLAGTVTLVGAGPGDPELITVKGLLAVQKADCIIYDRLIAKEILDAAKPGCELIYAGKASRNHTMPQEEINRLLMQKSMEFENTVRLKGGDAYVFGRGGEECLFLREKGVPFRVICGVSSCIAAPACAGIPVTHRGMSSGFHVVTAHDRNDALSDLDFKAMAKGNETCIFLMGLSKIEEIAERLMDAGMAEQTQIAVISQASGPKQKCCVSDLKHIAEEVKRGGLVSPAVIVAGSVVSLRQRLNMPDNRPLSGRRYLIPKIGAEPTRLGRLLRKEGADTDELQTGRIVHLGKRFTADLFYSADWMVFSSRHGVEEFFKSFAESGLDVRILSSCRIAAVGRKTAEALKQYGICADLVPDTYQNGALAKVLKEHLTGREKVFHFKAANADSCLKNELKPYCRFEEAPVYENLPAKTASEKWQDLKENAYDGILFTCASSVERFFAAAGTEAVQCRIYSIGPKTTEALRKYGIYGVTEAKEADYEGMVRMVKQ